jgi:hypothetical protein
MGHVWHMAVIACHVWASVMAHGLAWQWLIDIGSPKCVVHKLPEL